MARPAATPPSPACAPSPRSPPTPTAPATSPRTDRRSRRILRRSRPYARDFSHGRTRLASRRHHRQPPAWALRRRALRGEAARLPARALAGAALRRGLEPPRQPREGLLRAARRRRRGALLDVAHGLRRAAAGQGRARRRLAG